MNMKDWVLDLKNNKRNIPILSFPVIQLMECSLKEFLNNSSLQAEGMKIVSERCHTGVGIGMMDLSIEAECFGSNIRFEDNEIPTVMRALVEEDASDLEVPEVSKRALIYLDAISKAKQLMDKPIFPGMIGPFSLAGRLLEVSEALALCYEDPDLVHDVLETATEFLIKYGKEFKKIGANGIIMAEPLAGILSPTLVQEFSSDYVKRIVDELQDDEFIVIYHNCGNNVLKMADSIAATGCYIYHFGNAIELEEMIKKMPKDVLIMGNIDPVGVIKDGSISSVEKATLELLDKCAKYDNFVLSSGCDVPHSAPWDNIDTFIKTGNSYYEK